jgi:hypothetical protein
MAGRADLSATGSPPCLPLGVVGQEPGVGDRAAAVSVADDRNRCDVEQLDPVRRRRVIRWWMRLHRWAAPDSVPAASPRLLRSTSPWSPGRPSKAHHGVPRRPRRVHTAPGPYPPGLSGPSLRDETPVPCVLLFILARRTRTIWQYWHVPALSGCSHPHPAPPGSGCAQLHRPAARGSAAKVSHPPLE